MKAADSLGSVDFKVQMSDFVKYDGRAVPTPISEFMVWLWSNTWMMTRLWWKPLLEAS